MDFIHQAQMAIGYEFRTPSLLREAFTHRSFLQGKPPEDVKNNERLEFLGDAVLALVVSEYLASSFPTYPEGELSKAKARLVSKASLAQAARRLELGKWLQLGRGEEVTQGRTKRSLLANTLEAIIAAIYLDGGLAPAREFVQQALEEELDSLKATAVSTDAWDYKSRLQERCHIDFETTPQYVTVQESGPDHHKTFQVEVRIKKAVYGSGTGESKKEAEQLAAKEALARLTSSSAPASMNGLRN